jgi:hypothetical protein
VEQAPAPEGAPEQLRNRGAWWPWVAAHAAGALLGCLLGALTPAWSNIPAIAMFSLLAISIFQDIVLARFIPGMDRGKWSLITILGGSLAAIIALISSSFSHPYFVARSDGTYYAADSSLIWSSALAMGIMAVPAGAIIGLFQFDLLRSYMKPTSNKPRPRATWIWTSVVGWALGLAAASLVANGLNSRAFQVPGPSIDVQGLLISLIGFVLGMTIIGAVTGIALARLVREGVLQSSSVKSDSIPTEFVRKDMALFYVTAVAIGGLFLCGGYVSAVESFNWPQSYEGPGVGSTWPPPSEFFLGARVIAVSMTAINIAYLLFISVFSIRGLRRPQFVAERPWRRHWSIVMPATVALIFINLFAVLAWLAEYSVDD